MSETLLLRYSNVLADLIRIIILIFIWSICSRLLHVLHHVHLCFVDLVVDLSETVSPSN